MRAKTSERATLKKEQDKHAAAVASAVSREAGEAASSSWQPLVDAQREVAAAREAAAVAPQLRWVLGGRF